MDEALLRLALARQSADNANFAGTPRQAVADGYAAVDNVLSALLLNGGQKHSFNHAVKLNDVKQHHPDAFASRREKHKHGSSYSPSLDWEDIEAFYSEWLQARYGEFEISASLAGVRASMARTAVDCGIRYLARVRGVEAQDLSVQVAMAARGYTDSVKDVALALIHDKMFSEAERIGEEYGSRLGTKLAATTNYCDLDVVAGDALTRTILSEDEEIADAVVEAYTFFVRVVDQIQEKRLAKLNPGKSPSDCSREDIDPVPDFMFVLKARFHGSTVGERARGWASTLAAALGGIAANLEETNDAASKSTRLSTVSRRATRRRARDRS